MQDSTTTERPHPRSPALPRVLHVVARMPYAGTERQLAGMLTAARGALWNPTLCVLYAGYPLAAELMAAGVDVVELPADTTHLGRASAVSALLRHGGYDVVHTSLWGASALTRVLARTGCTAPVVMSERRVEDWRPAWRRLLDRRLEPSTAAFIGNSPEVAAFIARAHRAPRDKIAVVPNGIDTSVFRPRPARADTPNSRWRIGSIGRLVHQKGFDVLIDAVATLADQHDVEALIAGEGELRGELERRAAGLPIRFVGRLDAPGDVADFLHSLDVFAFPSRYEGRPNALIEALACGLPVVATDAPGVRSTVGPGLDLVPIDDPHALAAALEGRKGVGRRRPPPLPSYDDAARAHLAVFRRVLDERRGRADAHRHITATGREHTCAHSSHEPPACSAATPSTDSSETDTRSSASIH